MESGGRQSDKDIEPDVAWKVHFMCVEETNCPDTDQLLYRILNLQFDFSKIVCCSNLGKIVMYDFTHGMDTQFLL